METQKNDTAELLKECSAGSKMAVDAIDQILPMTEGESLRRLLSDSKQKHTILGEKIHKELAENGQREEDPPAMAKAMAHVTTSVKMMLNGDDHQVAGIITDGCNMGIKSLHEYLNQYRGAAPEARKLAGELADLEASLMEDLQPYL
ncbi:MAG: hypothetical protein PUC59_02055 [Firmicutes bacterium]|nr:hypothetical protein [Bacillota bacterium]